MKPTFTIETCRQVLEACSQGADFKKLATIIGVSPTTISHWYKRGSFKDDDVFKGHPYYQLFACSIEIGGLVYNLQEFKNRIFVNCHHQTPSFMNDLARSMNDLNRNVGSLKAMEYLHREMSIPRDHVTKSSESQRQIDTQIESLLSYYESLIIQVIKFEPTWRNVNMGRPRKNID